ncbi:hypothetical protein R69927_06804 [Paraburkholderia domus]|jgi:hypothetical protein|uniref:Uncharacterized protein n=2 Tax=Paraburkholderia domus TaxID=2793075 RepID=A0A9N8MKX9_9BURK|nr:hypothetical protein R69749_01108 [Paraburkholderia domus]CAE6837871.1 hypothetical protein R70006_06964 [Paraburkholderia domus]CAE6843470.1 hypothetical protein R75483_07259 [Paraburkholderia domus]CAE6865823.1 hypothetical protein R70211_00789 [Paraburkholderia domus]CAE6925294.1 hypothetical protein R69927_06804 [Paraburkholderia domus]
MPVANFTLVNKNFPGSSDNPPHVKIVDLATGGPIFDDPLPLDIPIQKTVVANDSGEGNVRIWRDQQDPYDLAVDDDHEYSLS